MGNENYRLSASMSNSCYSGTSFQERMNESYQSKINNNFEQSTSVKLIKEEYPYGSGEFRDLLCRVVSVRTVGTGSKMSDSYKTIIFKTQDHPKSVGYLYKFEDNYWIACNSDIMSSPTDSVVVRRCNNILRWKDDNGKIQSVPISFEEEAFYLNNEIKQDLDRNNGYRKAIIQRTELTKTLKPNQRFIFGNQCLKISGSGLSSFLNQSTDNDDSPSVIRLNFEYDYVNPAVDDMVNKVANAFSNEYTIKIDQNDLVYAVSSNSYTFSATVLDNNIIVSKDLVWTVNSSLTYTMSQSDNKLSIVFNDVGTYTINVCAKNNVDLKTSIIVTTVSTDKYNIQCSPLSNVIYKDESETFTFSLYKNGQIVNDAVFDFERIDKLTEEYYTYTKNGNMITITNRKMSSANINVKCSVLNYQDVQSYTLIVRLGGKW